MGIICGGKRYTRLARDTHELRYDALLVHDAVILKLYIIIPLPENREVAQGCFLGSRIVACGKSARYLAGKAGGHTYKTLVILFDQLKVDPRAVIEALGIRERDHFDKVPVALLVLAEQDKVKGREIKL